MFLKRGLLLVGCTLGLLWAQMTPAQASDIESLPGYSRMTVGQKFEEYLKNHPDIIRILAENRQLSTTIMRNASLQSQLQHGKVKLVDLLSRYGGITPHTADEAPPTDVGNIVSQAQEAVKNRNARAHAAQKIDSQLTAAADFAKANKAEIEAQLALAALITSNPVLTDYFINHPEAYLQILSGELKIDDILSNIPQQPPPATITPAVVTVSGNE